MEPTRRCLLKAVGTIGGASIAGVGLTGVGAAKTSRGLDDGIRVEATQKLPVYSAPTSISYSEKEWTADEGALGTISAGPYTDDGRTWWYVDFYAKYEGWCVGEKLAPAVDSGLDAEFTRVDEGGYSRDQRDQADVVFGSNSSAIRIDGVLDGQANCLKAGLGSVEYDESTDELLVEVAAIRNGEADSERCSKIEYGIHYRAEVTVDGGLPGTVRVKHEYDDTSVSVTKAENDDSNDPGGSPDLAIANHRYQVLEVEPGTEKESSAVRFRSGSNSVLVYGTTTGQTGCHSAKLAGLGLEDGSELSVDVETFLDADPYQNCTDVDVQIDYIAEITFEGGLPKSVAVNHDGETVQTARKD